MNWTALEQEIADSFTVCKVMGSGGRVLLPRAPIRIGDIVDRFSVAEEDKERIYDEGLGGFVLDRWAPELIINFEWEGFGPITWRLGIFTFTLGGSRTYICMEGEEETGGQVVIAALEPCGGALLQLFFEDLLSDNGESYDYSVFRSLPTMTENRRADLLPTSSVRDAFTKWMTWSEMHGGSWWDQLTYLRHKATKPDHLKRVLGLTKELHSKRPLGGDRPPLDRPEGGINRPIFQWERNGILDLYFELSYRCSPHSDERRSASQQGKVQ